MLQLVMTTKTANVAVDRFGRDSTAFRTDQYEVGNLQGALESGVASRRAVFEVFARRLPPGRRYGVFAGLGRIIDGLARFRFTEATFDRFMQAQKL